METKEPRKRHEITVTIVFIFVMLFWAIPTMRSSNYFDQGVAALERGDNLSAITYFERSALFPNIGNYYVEGSIKELIKIRDNSSLDNKLFSRQAENALQRIEPQIYPVKAPIIGKQNIEHAPGGMSLSKRITAHLLFILWVAGAVWFFFKGFTKEGNMQAGHAFAGFGTFAISLCLWLLLLAA